MKTRLVGLSRILLASYSVLFLLLICSKASAGPQAPPNTADTVLPDRLHPSVLSLQLIPGVDIPIGESSSTFGLGAGLTLGLEYRFPSLPLVYLWGDIGYSYDTANRVPMSVSVLSTSLGAGLHFDPMPWMSARLGVSAGYFACFLHDPFTPGGNPFVSGDAEVMVLPAPWRLVVGASYKYLLNFYSGLSTFAGLCFEFPPSISTVTPSEIQNQAPAKVEPLQSPKEKPSEKPSVRLQDLSLEDIFPVFRTYYDTHPLGKVTLSNTMDQSITDIKVSFQIKEFMDDPKESPVPSQLKPGETAIVELFGLFRSNVLEITEATKAQAKIDLEYTLKGQVQHQSLVQTIRILDRNCTTWTDDRRAAAFVTVKDPEVLSFSKNVNSAVKGRIKAAINPNLLTAIAFHETLHLLGLTYSQDPLPITITTKQATDYIQFPRQTLQYKGGKCSDLSVLYSALLESVGIETAFITIPGHIFVALSLGLSPDEARRAFSQPDDLIFRFDKSWIPVEVTESAGFLQAWQDGAKEWRENLASNQVAFYSLREAWKLYEPVGLSGAEAKVGLPQSDKILERYQQETSRYIQQEISPKVAAIEAQIKEAQDRRMLINGLGVLYAKFGLYDQAREEFEKLLATEDYVPALVNMGHIHYLNGQKEKALDYYKRAYTKAPENPKALLAFARVNHDLENYYEAKKAYADLKAQAPALARQFAYLDLKGEEATRQAAMSGAAEVVIWEE